jgi:superfamily II DNA helicase RecQ
MRTYRRSPSPWLAGVEAAVNSARSDAEAPAAGAGLAAARAQVTRTRHRAGAAATAGAGGSELLDALLEWRRNLARASGVPAYVIFHDSTLEAVARDRPRSRGDLLTIPGIGPVKVERHGAALLDLVGRHGG